MDYQFELESLADDTVPDSQADPPGAALLRAASARAAAVNARPPQADGDHRSVASGAPFHCLQLSGEAANARREHGLVGADREHERATPMMMPSTPALDPHAVLAVRTPAGLHGPSQSSQIELFETPKGVHKAVVPQTDPSRLVRDDSDHEEGEGESGDEGDNDASYEPQSQYSPSHVHETVDLPSDASEEYVIGGLPSSYGKTPDSAAHVDKASGQSMPTQVVATDVESDTDDEEDAQQEGDGDRLGLKHPLILPARPSRSTESTSSAIPPRAASDSVHVFVRNASMDALLGSRAVNSRGSDSGSAHAHATVGDAAESHPSSGPVVLRLQYSPSQRTMMLDSESQYGDEEGEDEPRSRGATAAGSAGTAGAAAAANDTRPPQHAATSPARGQSAAITDTGYPARTADLDLHAHTDTGHHSAPSSLPTSASECVIQRLGDASSAGTAECASLATDGTRPVHIAIAPPSDATAQAAIEHARRLVCLMEVSAMGTSPMFDEQLFVEGQASATAANAAAGAGATTVAGNGVTHGTVTSDVTNAAVIADVAGAKAASGPSLSEGLAKDKGDVPPPALSAGVGARANSVLAAAEVLGGMAANAGVLVEEEVATGRGAGRGPLSTATGGAGVSVRRIASSKISGGDVGHSSGESVSAKPLARILQGKAGGASEGKQSVRKVVGTLTTVTTTRTLLEVRESVTFTLYDDGTREPSAPVREEAPPKVTVETRTYRQGKEPAQQRGAPTLMGDTAARGQDATTNPVVNGRGTPAPTSAQANDRSVEMVASGLDRSVTDTAMNVTPLVEVLRVLDPSEMGHAQTASLGLADDRTVSRQVTSWTGNKASGEQPLMSEGRVRTSPRRAKRQRSPSPSPTDERPRKKGGDRNARAQPARATVTVGEAVRQRAESRHVRESKGRRGSAGEGERVDSEDGDGVRDGGKAVGQRKRRADEASSPPPKKRRIAPGVRVLAVWADGYAYPGRIASVESGGRVGVAYDDGDRRVVPLTEVCDPFALVDESRGDKEVVYVRLRKGKDSVACSVLARVPSAGDALAIRVRTLDDGTEHLCSISDISVPPETFLLCALRGALSVDDAAVLPRRVGERADAPVRAALKRRASRDAGGREEGKRVKEEVVKSKRAVSMIFVGWHFLVTSGEKNSSEAFDRDDVTEAITSRGGTIIEELSPSHVAQYGETTVLVSDAPKRTQKYLQGFLKEFGLYVLPAGFSLERKCERKRVPTTRNLFGGLRIHVHGSRTVKDRWGKTLTVAGASLVDKLPGSRALASDGDAIDRVCDLVIADEDPPRSVLERANVLAAPVLRPEWVVQSIVHGRLMDPRAHEQYRHALPDGAEVSALMQLVVSPRATSASAV